MRKNWIYSCQYSRPLQYWLELTLLLYESMKSRHRLLLLERSSLLYSKPLLDSYSLAIPSNPDRTQSKPHSLLPS